MKLSYYHFLAFVFMFSLLSCSELKEEKQSREEWIPQRFNELKEEYGVPWVDLYDIDPSAYGDQFTRAQIEEEMRLTLAWYRDNWGENFPAKIDSLNRAEEIKTQRENEELAAAKTARDSVIVLLRHGVNIPQDIMDSFGLEIERVPVDTSMLKH